jgi:hypothetical protein
MGAVIRLQLKTFGDGLRQRCQEMSRNVARCRELSRDVGCDSRRIHITATDAREPFAAYRPSGLMILIKPSKMLYNYQTSHLSRHKDVRVL